MQPDISQLRQEDWQEEFDLGTLERGRSYAAQGRSTVRSRKSTMGARR